MDKIFKIRYESAKQDTINFKKEIYNMKTFYPDDPNLSDRDKELVERTYYLFKVVRKLLKTFADNKKCARGLYVNKIEPRIDNCFAEAKCASSMYTQMSFIYEQVVHDIRFDNCRDDYIIAMNSL
jgi:hypothetical protein